MNNTDVEQIVISFMLSAYLTVTLVIIHYAMDRGQTCNSIDLVFLNLVVPKALTIKDPQALRRWVRGLEAGIVLLGDTQIITSVAILLSGYTQLPCGMSTYHWVMVVDLAWFSAITHLAALTSLRHYFRRRPATALWRVILMGISRSLSGCDTAHWIRPSAF